MKTLEGWVGIGVCGLLLASCDGGGPRVEADFVVQGVSVLDVEHAQVLADQDIAIRGGRIVAVGPTGAQPFSDDATVVPGQGLFALPGLYDMHVHVNTEERLALMLPTLSGVGITRDDVVEDLGPNVLYGVTSVALLGGSPGLVDLARSEEGLLIPRLFVCSPILDGPDAKPTAVEVADPQAADSIVDDIASRGYDAVKVYSSLTEPVFKEILARATARNLPVFGHLPPAIPLDDVLDPRLTDVAHAEEILRYWDREDTTFADSAAALLADRGISLTPNLITYSEIIAQIGDLEGHLAAKDTAVIPPIARLYSARENNGYVEQFGGDDIRDRAQTYFETSLTFMKELTARAQARGVPLMAGTDVGNPTMFPGQALIDELELLHSAGLSPWEVLRTATSNPAALLRETGTRGALAVDHVADMVLVDRNPVTDLEALRHPRAVFLRGRYLDQDGLAELRRSLAQDFGQRERDYTAFISSR